MTAPGARRQDSRIDLRSLESTARCDGGEAAWVAEVTKCPGLGPAAAQDILSAIRPLLDDSAAAMDVRSALMPTFLACRTWGGAGTAQRGEERMKAFEGRFTIEAKIDLRALCDGSVDIWTANITKLHGLGDVAAQDIRDALRPQLDSNAEAMDVRSALLETFLRCHTWGGDGGQQRGDERMGDFERRFTIRTARKDLRALCGEPAAVWEAEITKCYGLGAAAARDIRAALQPVLRCSAAAMDVRSTLMPTFLRCHTWGGDGDAQRGEQRMREFECMFIIGAARNDTQGIPSPTTKPVVSSSAGAQLTAAAAQPDLKPKPGAAGLAVVNAVVGDDSGATAEGPSSTIYDVRSFQPRFVLALSCSTSTSIAGEARVQHLEHAYAAYIRAIGTLHRGAERGQAWYTLRHRFVRRLL